MEIKKTEVQKFARTLKERIEKFTYDLEEYSTYNEESDSIDLEEFDLSDEMEILIISINQFAEKVGIKLHY